MAVVELTPEQLRLATPPERFPVTSTAQIEPTHTIIGQPRGTRAIEFGLDIHSPGFNVFVLGPAGTGRTTAIERFLRTRAAQEPAPEDWIYVNDFAKPEEPRCLNLPAGVGSALRGEMRTLIEDLRHELPRAFEGESYVANVEKLRDELDDARHELIRALEAQAAAHGFAISQTSSGMNMVPTRNGEPLSTEEIDALPEAQRREIEAANRSLEHEVDETVREIQTLERNARERLRQLDRDVASVIVDALIAEMKRKYASFSEALLYLDEVREDILSHLSDFRPDEEESQNPSDTVEAAGEPPSLRRYSVNVLVDNSGQHGAPVIVEDNPILGNLIGRVEHEIRSGALTTDFTLIRAGALHRANGGYLLLRASHLLADPPAWQALKRALAKGKIGIDDLDTRAPGAPAAMGLKPEPIPLHVKVILLGGPDLYYMLYENEEDFQKLFKVKADFTTEMVRTPDNEMEVARFIATRCREENLPDFSPAGIARVIEFAAWLANHQQRLSTRFGVIADLVREAAYWCSRNDHRLVTAQDVDRAMDERIYRSNLYEEQTLDEIHEGVIAIDTENSNIGQVNGLAVIDAGDYCFGIPTRISARTFLGRSGVVDIDREVELSDPYHDKGVLNLVGYLGGQYAHEIPLTLSAQITFEQGYAPVGGDSASSGELYAILSSLSGLPVRQDIAVTGAVNQRGEIEPIGGVTQKVEGFFAICRKRGLTGTQGVIIPIKNTRHLMLRPEVVEAVAAGKFHIWAIDTVDQGIELLTGVLAGQPGPDGNYPEGTVHFLVQRRLQDMAERLRAFDDGERDEHEA